MSITPGSSAPPTSTDTEDDDEPNREVRVDSGRESDQRREGAGGEDPGGDAGEAPRDDRGGGEEGGTDSVPSGDIQRALFLPVAGPALVRGGGAGSRSQRRETADDRPQVQN